MISTTLKTYGEEQFNATPDERERYAVAHAITGFHASPGGASETAKLRAAMDEFEVEIDKCHGWR